MDLNEILKSIKSNSSPFDFAEKSDDSLVRLSKKSFSTEKQIGIERAIQKALMHTAKNTRFERKKSKKSYPQYAKEYYSRLSLQYAESNSNDLQNAINASQIIYVGDFHPLKDSKTALLNLLKKTKVPINLCMECVSQSQQIKIVKYMQGDISQIPFSVGWYAPQDLFGAIFEYAKAHKDLINLVAIGPNYSEDGDFSTSDKIMAPVVARNAINGRKTFVFTGDYHNAPNHLPAKVKKQSGISNDLIIYQNSTNIYWNMRKGGSINNIVRLSKQEFCLFNTSPLVKYQSAIDQFDDENYSSLTPDQKVSKILKAVYLHLLLDNINQKSSLDE